MVFGGGTPVIVDARSCEHAELVFEQEFGFSKGLVAVCLAALRALS
jgi:hypothetical protein